MLPTSFESWRANLTLPLTQDPETAEDTPLAMPDVLTKSNLHRKVTGKLTNPYNVMSTFFFRRSVEKAFQLDESPGGLSLNMSKPIDSNPPFIISAVDDVMYIVSAVVQRSMSTSHKDVVASVIPTIGRVLGSDFVGMVQRKMRDESYPKPVVQGGFPPEDKIVSFIVLINSLDMATEYLALIVTSRLGADGQQHNGTAARTSLSDSFPFDHDGTLVHNALNNLNTSFSSKATELLNEGIQVVFNHVIKSRLRPVLTDTFRDADYTLSEEELVELAAQNDEDEGQLLEQVPRRFEHGWDALLKPISRIMTPRTSTALLDLTARYLARVLEKRVWSYTGRITVYGAIRMERDFNGIIGAVARGNYSVRELFAKTTQILTLANMEEDEWDELTAEEGGEEEAMAWVLSEEERRRARNLVRN